MHRKDRLSSYLFLMPPFLFYTAFIVIPIFASLYFSLTKWSGMGAMSFIGLKNFIKLFSSDEFWAVMANTGIIVLASIFGQSTVAIIFAYLLYRTTRGYRVFRALFFLPVVIAPMAVGLMFLVLYNSDVGPINQLFISIGLDNFARQWLSDPQVVLFSVIFPQLWHYLGFILLIFLTGMQSIPESIIDSAKVDGVSSISMFTRIVFPMIRNVVIVVVILNITGALKSFDYSFILTAGGPGVKSCFLAVYMFRQAFSMAKMGNASSVAVIILVLSLLSTTIINRFFYKQEI
jgi:raffinose/stachyose/melibiose transport system permease protein